MSSQTETLRIDSAERPAKETHRSMGRLVWERFKEHRLALAGLVVLLGLISMALGADVIAHLLHLDPNAQDILTRYSPRSAEHWLGTDEAGRDVLIRLIYGARISMGVAFVSAFASLLIGITIGSLAGYYGGWVDTILMRLTDALLTLPLLPILILLAAVDLSKVPLLSSLLNGEDSSVTKMIIIFIAFAWMTEARLVRSAVLAAKNQDYVLAAQTMGCSDFWVIVREILPNILSPVIVSVTLNVGGAILFEAALSFLGLGIQPPTPSWGNMLNNAMETLYAAPSLVVVPGLFILSIVVSLNFLGDGLQDALDPKALKR